MLPPTSSSDNQSDAEESVWPTPPGAQSAKAVDPVVNTSEAPPPEQPKAKKIIDTPPPQTKAAFQPVLKKETLPPNAGTQGNEPEPVTTTPADQTPAPQGQTIQIENAPPASIQPENAQIENAQPKNDQPEDIQPEDIQPERAPIKTVLKTVERQDAAGSNASSQAPSKAPWEDANREPTWKEGEIIKVEISDLSNGGDGVGRWEDRVVFVPNTVPGDEMRVKLTKVKASHGFGKPAGIVKPSPQRVRPACIVADKCGGCQWQQVGYEAQLSAKHHLVVDALARIGKLEDVRVDPVIAAEKQLSYRNKATYPVRLSQTKKVQAGYYRKGSHRLVNLNQCPVQDDRLDPLLAGVKQDIQDREWKIYDERTHKGHIKHLSLRIGQRTGQILLTLVSRSVKLKGIHEQAQQWMERYPEVSGVLVNLNWKKTNAIFGPETFSIAGEPYLEENFAGLNFHIQPATFFQVNTTQAELLLEQIETELALTGEETLVDAYCGVGTFTLPLARKVKQCIGLEAFTESVVQAQANAALNDIENVEFKIGDVGALLPDLESTPDIVLLDPPRKGCEPEAIAALVAMKPKRIVYVSCNPATLARDLRILCEEGGYTLTRVQPADFFPQTSHVECAAFLVA